jgi:hypothetical protein
MQIVLNLYKSKDGNFSTIIARLTHGSLEPLVMTKNISNDFLREQRHSEHLIECEISTIVHNLVKELVQEHEIKPEQFFIERKENE